MKKVIKILLIVLLCFVIAYGIKMLYGLWIWNNVSSDDQLKIAQSAYAKCKVREGKNCENLLAKGLMASMSTEEKEKMATVMDKNKTEEERIQALKDFYMTVRLEKKEMDEKEVDFYYVVAYDEENPLSLSRQAFEYFIKQETDDEDAIEIQMSVANDSDAEPKYRESAIMALGNIGVKEAADIFINVLKEEGSVPRFSAGHALVQIGAVDKMSDLADIALDESKDIPIRSQALETMNGMIESYQEAKNMDLVDRLKPLLDNENVAIWANAADVLESLTGEEYGRNELTDEEVEEYMSNSLENILIPGVDY